MKRPSFQFYPGDWLRSTDLRSCSVGARGLWIDMICLMHEGEPYGYLRVGNKDILPPILAKMVGATQEEVINWLKELSLAGVFSESQRSGCIFSRRMVRDEKLREIRAQGGFESLKNPNVPRPRISSTPSLDPSPASSSSSASSSKPKSKKSVNGFNLPSWVPVEHWNAWVEARIKARKPPTDYAKRLAVLKLENLRDQGHEPTQVLMQSAFNGWADLFAIKEKTR